MAAIRVNETQVDFTDHNQNRRIFESTANGIAIGTFGPEVGYAVTMPSLIVTGNLGVGLIRVSSSYQTNNYNSSCHAHGDLPCYWGTTTVSCPVGTQVLGGGSSGTPGIWGSIGATFPPSASSWYCAESYDLENSYRDCYAICARMN